VNFSYRLIYSPELALNLSYSAVPSGTPTAVRVEAVNQTTLNVMWKPPEHSEWNGEILGYYVGYKLASSENPYLYETVEFSKEEGKEHHLPIHNLK